MVEVIKYNDLKLAIIIRAGFKNTGIEFFTEDQDSQQLGFMTRPKGHIIIPHRHNLIERKVHLTQEVLFIKSGIVRCDFFDNYETYVISKILSAGDVVLLCDGGHGFEILETAEIVEVKQGPYCGSEDKVHFNSNNDIKF
jgi:hypothetical protein